MTYNSTQVFGAVADELLAMRTRQSVTVLSNDKGLWMEGIIGPIIDYEIKLGSDSVSNGITIGTNVKISVLNLDQFVTATVPSGTYQGAIWKATNASRDFYTSKMASGTTASIKAKDILFSSDRLIQQFAEIESGNYVLYIDVSFLDVPVYEIETVPGSVGVKIGGLVQTSANVFQNTTVTIEGVFDEILYEFDAIIITPNTPFVRNQNTITLTPTNDITIEYRIKPREYSVQILGKTTNNGEVFVSDTIKDGYAQKISYNEITPVKLNIGNLAAIVEDEYFVEGMFFEDTGLYVFDHFQCNGVKVTGELTIDTFMLHDNPRVDGKFTVYAVYQKKYILSLGFEFDGNVESESKHDLSSPSAEEFNRFGINGYAINEGDTAVIILKPDKRYTVDAVVGDNGTSQISADLPELLVVRLDKSYEIVVKLDHRTIKVDYVLNITDNNNREIFGVPDYIGGGTGANYTMISYESLAQALAPNQATLDLFNYRSTALKIYNFETNQYDLITDKFADGKLDAKNDDFFKFYVDENGNSKVCLFVIQQYFVDFSTPGFTQNGTTFKNDDLGSYTIEFVGGSYTSLGDGKYMVDFGTQIKLMKEVGQYGNFQHFTGLTDNENDTQQFTVFGDRYVGVNFESTKLASWIMPTIYGGSGFVALLVLMTIILIMRSVKLKKQKLAREAEIRDMKRKFNISDEIAALREGRDIPQS